MSISTNEGLIRAKASEDDAEDRLRRLIADPADRGMWALHIDPVDEPAARVALPDVDAAVARALDARYDVARARNDVGIAATTVEYLSNQMLPDVRVEASYRGSGLGGSQLLRTGGFPGSVTGRVDSGFGDDRTDEEMFTALPRTGISIHVGGGASLATHRLRDPQAVRAFLAALLDAAPQDEASRPKPQAEPQAASRKP